jgi:capsular exopolysaccharide synthesis family protein
VFPAFDHEISADPMTDHAHFPVPMNEGGAVAPPRPGAVAEPWPDDDLGGGGEDGQSAKRILAALRRYRGLVIASAVLGIGAGYVAYQMGQPEYQVEGSFWLTQRSSGDLAGPLAQGILLSPRAFTDLMRTGAVLTPAIISERLYLRTGSTNETAMADFRVDGRGYMAGRYALEVSADGGSWELRDQDGLLVESGRPGEPVGRQLGMIWTPPRSELTPDRRIEFTVLTAQDAARDLRSRIVANPTQDGNFINFTLRGEDPVKIASILSAVMEQLRIVAGELKTAQLDSSIANLQQQLGTAQRSLDQARTELEGFKISTATLPMDDASPVSAGLQQTQTTVYGDFFTRRIQLDELQRQRASLEGLLATIPETGVRVEAFEVIPPVTEATELRQALGSLVAARSDLRTLLQDYTDAYGPVTELRDNIEQMEQRDIPSLTRGLIGQLRAQEEQHSMVLSSREDELRRIPPRTIREATLQQDVETAEKLYLNVLTRLDENRLAKASTQPDLQTIQTPEVPREPASDERITWFAMAFLASLGLGVGAAVVLDRFDPRLRYPTEVSRTMGLEILGAVPRIRGRRRQNAGQVLEAFREIRMRVQYAYGNARPLVLAVTSPESGEGKTFVTANLGITFAQLGRKTLVIDADTRRGDMHDLFELDRKPGLTDLFRRRVDGSVIQPTKHDNLHFLSCGSRRADSPDLLSSGDMQELLASAKRRYEVILFDCPPMAAGSDAFILGAHAGSVLMVLRSGSTHKELARAKMEAFYRLPVRLLGAVLNDIEPNASYGAYRYYSYYLPGYRAGDEEEEDTRVVAM